MDYRREGHCSLADLHSVLMVKHVAIMPYVGGWRWEMMKLNGHTTCSGAQEYELHIQIHGKWDRD